MPNKKGMLLDTVFAALEVSFFLSGGLPVF